MTAGPTASPPLIRLRRFTSKRRLASGTSFIIILSAVGNRKALRMPYFSIRRNARSGSKRPRNARMGHPKCQVGSSASNKPPVHAQSAGDQNMSPARGKKSCEQMNPGRLPSNARCGISAPFGDPVVPLV